MRAAGLGRTLGLEVVRLEPEEIARRHPLVATRGLVGGIGIPADAAFLELAEDWDHVLPRLEAAMARLPVLRTAGIRKLINGPKSFTPDDRYLLGEAPELPGFWVACGVNAIGIQPAGGAWMALAG